MRLLSIDPDSDDDEGNHEDEGEVEIDEEVIYADAASYNDSEWKLKNGKLVAEILVTSAMKALKNSKTAAKNPDAFVNSSIWYGVFINDIFVMARITDSFNDIALGYRVLLTSHRNFLMGCVHGSAMSGLP